MLKLGVYRHFKGKEYLVTGIARDANTLEEIVEYEALYEDPKYGKNAKWIRQLREFTEIVDKENYSGPRFVYLREK